ncbi:lipoate--protein ligase family protein [Cupriavidus pauculus]|uniref:Lipoate--protein ligase family protein n=1 Tax=Cupriavidus pauculus TaxID=82633 RepID=A0A3G8H6Z9_9BURK|nr:lipoate--protein ligase family protein [Cupriavidus pauculus]AZG16158.1 lipoate--protein ligase family protein [Cupriavidus pauculus]
MTLNHATRFAFVDPDPAEADPLQGELALLDHAARQGPVAQLWEAPLSLVIPRSYLRQPGIEAARADFAARGCPVWLRMSGGGLVPQGPGILNVSLAYAVPKGAATWMEPVYLHLCEVIAAGLRQVGVETHWQAVEGSFCDGRYNLAWGPGDAARKIAGTAQYWRRAPADAQSPDGQRHLVLAHAILLVDADPEAINARANAFEAAIGSGRHYDPAKVVSVREAAGLTDASGLAARVSTAIQAAIAAAPPPGQ